MAKKGYDFSGWATRNDLLCGDGRTIRKDAFKDNDGQEVPLVWNHQHNEPENVLGHALLENREEGVYAYCTFNDSESGQAAKELVKHGDVRSLSIYANKLKQIGGDVIHGKIRELSLVLAGANPGAYIDYVMAHGEDTEDEMEACWDENSLMLYHSDEDDEKEEPKKEEKEMSEEKGKTIGEVFETLNEEQKTVVYAMIGQALAEAGAVSHDDLEEEGEDIMKHNLFENEGMEENVLTHADMEMIIADGRRYGSLRDSFLAHAQDYGIESIEYLFPEVRNQNMPPEFIGREMGWVSKVMSKTHHTPFSRIKSMYADITEDEARAKGYIKGKLKKEEVFSLLKRSTTPTTVYKKQKLDRDDMVDITDFDVVAWLKGEMRMMLDEELARAFLIGDGRLASSDDHINEQNIRPIVNDADLFVVRWGVAAGADEDERARNFIRAAIKSRKQYKGSGNPDLFTTEDMLTDMLLLEDGIGHKLYKTEQELATALRVKEIITVPVMEGFTDKDDKEVLGMIVNLDDYNVGADKGGSVNMFEDFDIDYNQQKYLIETRCSGALIKPFSAVVLRESDDTKNESPTMHDAMEPFK